MSMRDCLHYYITHSLKQNKADLLLIWALYCFVSGPLAAAIMDRTSGRVCAMIGCIGAACFLFMASMVNSFEVLFFSYGIMTGYNYMKITPTFALFMCKQCMIYTLYTFRYLLMLYLHSCGCDCSTIL